MLMAFILSSLITCNNGDPDSEYLQGLAATAEVLASRSRMQTLLNETPLEHGVFVAVGNSGRVLTSVSGEEWKEKTVGTADLFGADIGNNIFVAVGEYGRIVSTNAGESWENSTKDNNRLYSVVYGGNKFIACGLNGQRISSRDGRVWNSDFSQGKTLQSITYGNGLFLATGVQGETAFTTTNGSNWNSGKVPSFNDNVEGVTYGEGLYVAVGEYGMRAHSYDGVNWTIDAQDAGFAFESVAYGGGIFVAVGVSGRTAVSDDGIHWRDENNPAIDETRNLYSVASGNNKFIAVGYGGRIVSSTDGIHWNVVRTGGRDLNSITYAPDPFDDVIGEDGVCHTHWHEHENVEITDGKNGMHRHWHCHAQREKAGVHDHIH